MLFQSLDSVTDLGLKTADVICAVHMTDPCRSLQLWGQESVAAGHSFGEPATQIKVIEFHLNLDDDRAVQNAMNRVERVRGRLPADVTHFKHRSSTTQTEGIEGPN